MNRFAWVVVGLALIVATGCGGGVKEEDITIKAPSDPLANAKTILQNYANGQPLTSEVTSFPFLIEEARKADPAKGEILAAGLAEIQQLPPAAVPEKAKEILSKL